MTKPDRHHLSEVAAVNEMRRGNLPRIARTPVITGIWGIAAGVPFSVAAVAAHGTAGLVVGAAVALLSALVSSDRVFWLVTLILLNRHQRWAWAETRSLGSTRRLDEPGRRTVETLARVPVRRSETNE